MNPGKEFESRFHKSLDNLSGCYVERVHDNGGKPTRKTLCGDFRVSMPDNTNVAIECKSVGYGRIPFREKGKKGSGIHDEQLAELVRFERTNDNNKSLLALHWKISDSCILVNMDAICAYRKGSGYRSISEEDAAKIGWRQKPDGRGWKLRLNG